MTSCFRTSPQCLNPGWKFSVNCLLICLRFKYPNETRRFFWMSEHGIPSPRWEGFVLAIGEWAFESVRTWDWQHHGYRYYGILSANGGVVERNWTFWKRSFSWYPLYDPVIRWAKTFWVTGLSQTLNCYRESIIYEFGSLNSFSLQDLRCV